jgi:hydroxymethylpyrimidine pyrophosphatase-like HAD family hydrolase
MLQRAVPQDVHTALNNATDFVFDVDLTLTVRQGTLAPSLADVISRSGKRSGICTSRAMDELDEIFVGSGVSRGELFKGAVILEEGGVVILPGSAEALVLVAPAQAAAIQTLVDHLQGHMYSIPFEDKWKQLGTMEEPWVHLPTKYRYLTSHSLWQHSEHGMDHLRTVLHRTMDWCLAAVRDLKLEGLVHLTEIGDGTLRLSAPGINKGGSLLDLHEKKVLDLSRVVYFGDGRNDVPVARVIRAHNGYVVAVDRHCPELLELANYVTPARGPDGLERLLRGAGF